MHRACVGWGNAEQVPGAYHIRALGALLRRKCLAIATAGCAFLRTSSQIAARAASPGTRSAFPSLSGAVAIRIGWVAVDVDAAIAAAAITRDHRPAAHRCWCWGYGPCLAAAALHHRSHGLLPTGDHRDDRCSHRCDEGTLLTPRVLRYVKRCRCRIFARAPERQSAPSASGCRDRRHAIASVRLAAIGGAVGASDRSPTHSPGGARAAWPPSRQGMAIAIRVTTRYPDVISVRAGPCRRICSASCIACASEVSGQEHQKLLSRPSVRLRPANGRCLRAVLPPA